MTKISRRDLITRALPLSLAGMSLPNLSLAAAAREITWDDLIPPGIPYAEIIGEGEMDEANDIWRPIYDANATKLNADLHGAYIRMPGFILPLGDGRRRGQRICSGSLCGGLSAYPTAATQPAGAGARLWIPWPSEDLWDPVWVTGRMSTQLMTTEVAETGYALIADEMERYEW